MAISHGCKYLGLHNEDCKQIDCVCQCHTDPEIEALFREQITITKAQALGIYTTLMPQWLNRESMYYDDIRELLKQISERFDL